LEAQHWAVKAESDALAGNDGLSETMTFADLMMRYSVEVSSRKRGAKWSNLYAD
jgi:hypothetical protein